MPYYPRPEVAVENQELYKQIREMLETRDNYIVLDAGNRSPYSLAERLRVALRAADEFPDYAGADGPGLRDLVMVKVDMRGHRVIIERKPFLRQMPIARIVSGASEVISAARVGDDPQKVVLFLADHLRRGNREFKDVDVPNRDDVHERIDEMVEHLGVKLVVFDPPRLVFDSTK